MKKTKELSEIANRDVETRMLKIRSRDILYPMLDIIKDGKEYHINDLEKLLAEKLSVTNEELNQKLSSGQKRFLHRIGWTKWFLKKGELITTTDQAKFKINKAGLKFLNDNPNFTFNEFKKLPSWVEYKNKKKGGKKTKQTNKGQIEIKNELLEKIIDSSPYFFEKLVVDLLDKMEYGIGMPTKKSHDGGIDGIVTADKLGLSEIYVQAKRYSGSVPIAHIKEFIGTIQTTKTKTGVFITSGTLPERSHEYVLKSGLNIQLIDGKKLSDLMYEFDVGLKIKKTEPVKYIDEAFFVEEEL